MQGSVTFFQQSIYKNTAAGRKKLDTKFTQIQIVPPMQYQVMQTQIHGTFGSASRITRLEVLRIG